MLSNSCCWSIAITAKPWVSLDQVSKHLGIASDSIYRLNAGMTCLPDGVRGFRKFKDSEVYDWVRAGVVDEADREGGKNGR